MDTGYVDMQYVDMTIERNAEYWRKRKAEQRAKGKLASENLSGGVESGHALRGQTSDEALPGGNVTEERHKTTASGGSVPLAQRPEGCTEGEWELCKVRAHRAVRYAEMFPGHVRPSEKRFQDPLWQWENEVRGKGANGGECLRR